MSAPFSRRAANTACRPDWLFEEPRIFAPLGLACVLLGNAVAHVGRAVNLEARAAADLSLALIWAECVKAQRGEPAS